MPDLIPSPCQPLWNDAPAPKAGLLMCVVLPVRNEAMGLAATLASMAAQHTLQGSAFDSARFEVLVLANNCSDHSAAIARGFAQAHPALTVHVEDIQLAEAQAHIGHVRRLLMEAACRRLAHGGGFVVSTDGDTVVGTHWLAAMLQEFEAGADVVAGRILLDPRAALDPATLRHHRNDTAHRLAMSRLEALLDPDPADPWPRHHQHFGASLALRSQAYRQVGGIPDVRFLEDVALVDACRRGDLRVRHSPLVRVCTSPRREGRVEVGLSWQLRQWDARDGAATPMWVEDPDVFVARVQKRRALRVAWLQARDASRSAHAGAVPGVAPTPSMLVTSLKAQTAQTAQTALTALTSSTFGELWAQEEHALSLSEAMSSAPPPVPVRQAVNRLQALIRLHAAGVPARSSTSSR